MAVSDDFNVSYALEYRSKKDDAWYTCGVVMEDFGTKLRVKLKDFPQTYFDEVFSLSDFSNRHEIDDFLRRFRPDSEPVEDNECSKVIQGMMVCALYRDDTSERFFDAIVDDVLYKGHTPEKCECTYLLFWMHGPAEGNLSAATNLVDICLLKTAALDSKVVDFSNLAIEKLKQSSPKKPFLSRKTTSNGTLSTLQEFVSAGVNSYDGFSEGSGIFSSQVTDQNKDMGGVKDTDSHHYIVLENLEKDLSPISMMEFIHEQTSITAHAYVFPSLSAETYARGVIVLDCRLKMKRIYEFISNPNHFIVSSSGRPWVIAEDTLRTGTFDMNLQSLEPKFENQNTGTELKIVRLGTEEFKRAKTLKDLYMEFRKHLNGLVLGLDMKEKTIMQSLMAN